MEITIEDEIIDAFFGSQNLAHTIVVLSENNKDASATSKPVVPPPAKPGTKTDSAKSKPPKPLPESQETARQDSITMIVSALLTATLDLQLVVNGIIFFRNKEIVYPYTCMTEVQREILLRMMRDPELKTRWNHHELCLIWKTRPLVSQEQRDIFLNPVQVLHVVCELVMSSKQYSDKRSRLAICNIVLQRLHSQVNMTAAIQKKLNELLFSVDAAAHDKQSVFSESSLAN